MCATFGCAPTVVNAMLVWQSRSVRKLRYPATIATIFLARPPLGSLVVRLITGDPIGILWWPRRLTLTFQIMRRCDARWGDAVDDAAMRCTMGRCYAAMLCTMRRCDGRWGDAMDDGAMLWGDAMHDEAMRWTMRRCDGWWGDAMRRCDARWGDAMHDVAMLWPMRRCGNIAPSHRRIVHSIASSSIASPHRPSHHRA